LTLQLAATDQEPPAALAASRRDAVTGCFSAAVKTCSDE
jgi:hypothetical protein